MSSSEPPITPDEDSPHLKEKYVHDFRNVRSSRVVYGAGLCSTGAFAKLNLIVQPTAPEQVKLFTISFATLYWFLTHLALDLQSHDDREA
jgi:hypothetical protein